MELLDCTQHHEDWLSNLDKEVWAHLKRDRGRLDLKRGRHQVDTTRTQGVYVDVATAFRGSRRVSLELWLDQYLKPGRFDLYYCIQFRSAKQRRRLMAAYGKQALEYYQNRKLLVRLPKRERQTARNSGYVHLKQDASRKVLRSVVLDPGWPEGDYFGKMRIPACRDLRGVPRRLAKDIARFFSAILTSSGEIALNGLLGTVRLPEDLEGKRVTKEVVLIERKSQHALMRKYNDHYICQICKFDFAKKYPGIGEEFAEAHHKIPLSETLDPKKVSVASFITVCANCHRMLHWKKNRTANEVRAAFKRGRDLA